MGGFLLEWTFITGVGFYTYEVGFTLIGFIKASTFFCICVLLQKIWAFAWDCFKIMDGLHIKDGVSGHVEDLKIWGEYLSCTCMCKFEKTGWVFTIMTRGCHNIYIIG